MTELYDDEGGPRGELDGHKHIWIPATVNARHSEAAGTFIEVAGWTCECGRVVRADTTCELCQEEGAKWYIDVRAYRCRDKAACTRRAPQPQRPRQSDSDGTPKKSPYLDRDRISGTILYRMRDSDDHELAIAAAEIMADEHGLPVEVLGLGKKHVVEPKSGYERAWHNKSTLYASMVSDAKT